MNSLDINLRILKALRKIIKAVDTHSNRLNRDFHVTVPQMVCLYALTQAEEIMTCSTLSKNVDLSPSTVNGIIDRLESKNLAKRRRDDKDRRKVFVEITPQGRSLSEKVPTLLHDRFSQSLRELPTLEQTAIALSLERIVDLMDASHLDASPLLFPDKLPPDKNDH